MLSLLQSNLSLALGALLAVILLAVRTATQDKHLQRDLNGAIRLLIAFLVLRTVAWTLPETAPTVLVKVVRVGWMLTFAFGLIRASVGFGLKLMRLRARSEAPPKILRDVIDFTLYALAAVPILKTQLSLDLTGLVATSAVLSVVMGLALQETLGNLFAGLSLQLDRPFEVGHIIRIGSHAGRVVHIGWRSIRLATFRRELITLPNSMVAKELVQNFSEDQEPVGVDVELRIAHDAPPNQVKATLLDVMREIPQVLVEPPPLARTLAYDESCIRYMVRFFLADYALADAVKEELHTRLWYRLRRENIDIPYPQRTVHVRQEVARTELSEDTVRSLLRAVDLFQPLGPEDLDRLRQEVVVHRFGKGERIIQEGDDGRTFYVLASGEVSVRAGKLQAEVTRLGRGGYFGEMSLLTGEKRAATVVAVEDSLLLEVDRPTFARMFEQYPGLARQLSALLAQRRTQLRALAQAGGGGADPIPAEVGRILGRLRQIFGLNATHD
ncbi:mechanosensitive ion channel family protein [Pyxidicoccus sp. MSG2]|uniref:mechanosensitive ion channel family protein n=1 Tax=Pyxidicoccus sp. MSG2 TaxID=2996790 RepID=UPI00226DC156|nr:mechanosensitive ion channel family protein [Pyxidicoccus sp. MSG2]MCY1015074.1 mechanosensitive ion channel family protein [Pyxidicoccus sp. MSG2]